MENAKQDFFSTLLVSLIRTPRAPYNVTRRHYGFMFLGQIESINPSWVLLLRTEVNIWIGF